MSQVRISAQIRCPFCHDSILTGPRTGCPECLAWHHTACLEEHGACSTCTTPSAQVPRRNLAQEVSEVLGQVCMAQGCFSIETLDRPRRVRLCERHARAEVSGYTAAGVLLLIFGVGLGILMIALAVTGEPGPWPLLTIPTALMVGIGVLAIGQRSSEEAAIDLAVAKLTREAEAELESSVSARPRPQKVAS